MPYSDRARIALLLRLTLWLMPLTVSAAPARCQQAPQANPLTPQLVMQTVPSQFYSVNSVAFSPDGRTLASGGDGGPVELRDAATGRLLRTLTNGNSSVYSVAFSPDGRTLASGGLDDPVQLWDAASGQLIRTLTGHTNKVVSVSFSPNGRTLGSASDDGSVRLWDVAPGRELCSLYAFDDGGWAVVDPQGHFDGDAAGLTNLHGVIGLKPVALSRPKDRYYAPGLLSRLLGFSR